MSGVMMSVDGTLPQDVLAECRVLCAMLSRRLGRPVTLAYVDEDTLDDLRMWAVVKTQGAGVVNLAPEDAPAMENTVDPGFPARRLEASA
jgi:hypothetical protein